MNNLSVKGTTVMTLLLVISLWTKPCHGFSTNLPDKRNHEALFRVNDCVAKTIAKRRRGKDGIFLSLTNKTREKELSGEENPQTSVTTRRVSFTLARQEEQKPSWNRRLFLPFRKVRMIPTNHTFDYHYNQLTLYSHTSSSQAKLSQQQHRTTLVLLVQPIGIGIGRWYYDRLLSALSRRAVLTEHASPNRRRLIFIAPDLLACGSASDPTVSTTNTTTDNAERKKPKHIPLLFVHDWSRQLIDLMIHCESSIESNMDEDTTLDWCIVSNGVCVPIALDIAQQYVNFMSTTSDPHNKNVTTSIMSRDDGALFEKPLSQIILSDPPRLSYLLCDFDLKRVRRSYRILSGLVGRMFWFYALWNKGAFIQRFSEENLASQPENLGTKWTPTCVETARSHGGKSRFSTFAFLAGSLNGGCTEKFDSIKNSNMTINVITGNDVRKKQPRSWFWKKQAKTNTVDEKPPTLNELTSTSQKDAVLSENDNLSTLSKLLEQNGNGGMEIVVGGRLCPAHEDPEGFANALFTFIL